MGSCSLEWNRRFAKRGDFSFHAAETLRPILGYAGSIDVIPNAENTATGCRFAAVARAPYRITDFGMNPVDLNWIYVRIRAYVANALIPDGAPIILGSFLNSCSYLNKRISDRYCHRIGNIELPGELPRAAGQLFSGRHFRRMAHLFA